MPAAGAAVPAVAEGAGQLEDLDEPPEPRVRGGSGRAGLMKPLVVLALPGMYLFYKYSQYRREQRELSRRRVTERELQHLHHKIVSEFLVTFTLFVPPAKNLREAISCNQAFPHLLLRHRSNLFLTGNQNKIIISTIRGLYTFIYAGSGQLWNIIFMLGKRKYTSCAESKLRIGEQEKKADKR